MKKNFLKRIGALAMAMAMCFALAVCASAVEANANAEEYSVTIYKSGKTDLSMANDIVNGPATVTAVASGYRIDIPIKPIYNYSAMLGMVKADGYLMSLTVSGATSAYVTYNTENPLGTPYATATLTILTPVTPTAGITLNVTESLINLYKVNTDDPLTLMTHITPDFDIVLNQI